MQHLPRTLKGSLFALAAALLVAQPALAQGPPMQQQQQQYPPEVQAMLDELDQTQEKLEALQQQALVENQELQGKQAQIEELVESTLRVVEPEYEGLVTRFGELQQEAAAAQQAEDVEAFQAVMTEAQALQMRLQNAQAQAFETEEVDTAVTAYREELVSEMTRLDPEAPELMERMEALVEQLEAILG